MELRFGTVAAARGRGRYPNEDQKPNVFDRGESSYDSALEGQIAVVA